VTYCLYCGTVVVLSSRSVSSCSIALLVDGYITTGSLLRQQYCCILLPLCCCTMVHKDSTTGAWWGRGGGGQDLRTLFGSRLQELLVGPCVLVSTALSCPGLSCTVLYCTVLYCPVLCRYCSVISHLRMRGPWLHGSRSCSAGPRVLVLQHQQRGHPCAPTTAGSPLHTGRGGGGKRGNTQRGKTDFSPLETHSSPTVP